VAVEPDFRRRHIGYAEHAARNWYVLASAGLAFAGLGWFGRRLTMALRLAAWSAAAACAIPFVLLLVLIAADRVGQTVRAAKWSAAEDYARQHGWSEATSQ
jgi:hypothetical protein